MNGYSKIGSSAATATATATSHKSTRSVDFFSFPAQTPKPTTHHLQDEEEEEGERFGVILGRSCSVSSSGGTDGFQATMKRAFSIRRSSSVSERYCRIHDQNMAMASESDHDDKKKKQSSKMMIFKACKRLFRL